MPLEEKTKRLGQLIKQQADRKTARVVGCQRRERRGEIMVHAVQCVSCESPGKWADCPN